MTPGIGLHGVTLRWVPLIGMDPKPPRPAAPAVHTPVLVKGRSHTEPVRQRQILALLTDTWQTTVALRERLGIDKGAVTSAVKELEAKGLPASTGLPWPGGQPACSRPA